MRVLFVPSWYPSSRNSFAGAFIHDLAAQLVHHGMEIEVVAAHQNFTHYSMSRLTYDEERGGVLIHHLLGWAPPKMNERLQEVWIRDCIKRIDSMVDFSRIDMIHAQDYVGLFLADRIATKFDKPLLCTIHHSDFLMNSIPKWRKELLKEILPRTEICIVPSIALARAVEDQEYLRQQDIAVIPNYVRMEEIPAKALLGESPEKYILVSSSEKVKRPELAVRWMRELPGTLDIYGDVPGRRRLEILIRNLKLRDRVKLHGSLRAGKLLKLYSNYDACLCTSAYETFGISNIEALAAGIPVLAATRSGPADYIDESTGLIVDRVAEVKEFLTLYPTFNADTIREKIKNQYDVHAVLPKHLSMYRKIYARRCVV